MTNPTPNKIIARTFTAAFEQMCNFIAVAQTGNPSETIKGLVQLCLVINPTDKFYTAEQFVDSIETLFGVYIPEHQIQIVLEDMIRQGIISQLADTNLVLDSDFCKEIEKKIKEAKDLEDCVKNTWLEFIHKTYPELPHDKMWPVLRQYLACAFRRHGMQTAALIDPSIDTPTEYTESLSLLLNEVVADKFSEHQHEKAKNAISSFLSEVADNSDRSRYTAQLADGAFNFYSLEVSPDLAKKMSTKLSNLTLFLDTNFLFGILGLHYNSQVAVSLELIRVIHTHKLPFKLRYHEATQREMRNTLSYYSGVLRSRQWSQRLSRAAASSQNLMGIEQKYHEMNSKQKTDIDEFLRPYEHLDVLLNAQNIKIFRPISDRLKERTNLHSEYQSFLEQNNRADKTYEIINHDATILDAVREKRSNIRSTLEAGALLVSCDYLLYKFDWENVRKSNQMACVVLPNTFWQMIRPFVPSDKDFEKAFVQTFALPEFRSIGSGGSKACSKMLTILASYKDIPEETAFKLLSNDALLDKLKNAQKDNEFSACVEAAIIEENNHLIEEKAAILRQLEKEKEEKQNQSKEYDTKIKRVQAEKKAIEESLVSIKQMAESHKEESLAKMKQIAERHKEEVSIRADSESRIRRDLELKSKEVEQETKKRKQTENKLVVMSVIAAVSIGIVLIGAFEFCVYFFKWQWLLNHQNKLSLEIGTDIALLLATLALFVPRQHKMFWFGGVCAVGLILLGLLGR